MFHHIAKLFLKLKMLNYLDKLKLSNKILIISNAKHKNNLQDFINSYDFIIRFGEGSNSEILTRIGHLGTKTDLCCLNGWGEQFLEPINGFKDKHILLTRPTYQQKFCNFYKFIHIKKPIIEKLKSVTEHINTIPWEIFLNFSTKYNYWHPTSGIITIYYIAQLVDKSKLTVLNFFQDDNLYNNVTDKFKDSESNHNIKLEKRILSDLELNHIFKN